MFYVLFWVLLRNIAWEPATQELWVNCSDEVEEKPVYRWFLFLFRLGNTWGSSMHACCPFSHVWLCDSLDYSLPGSFIQHASWSKVTANHKEWIPQPNDFSVFLCLGKCRNLGSLKFFLRHASNYLRVCLSKANSASFCFSSWIPFRVYCGQLQWITIQIL